LIKEIKKNNMELLEEIYRQRCEMISDINEHLPTLKRYAEECEHITEMGVRWVVSTYAFMMGKPKKLISIDIDPVEKHGINTSDLVELAKTANVDFTFIVGDTREIEIEETDFLFIDTLHTFTQVKRELEIHPSKVRKYIGFHDTTTFGQVGEGSDVGLWPAITLFLYEHPEWVIHEKFENNNGLTILKRI
jgi:hypothetical protein